LLPADVRARVATDWRSLLSLDAIAADAVDADDG